MFQTNAGEKVKHAFYAQNGRHNGVMVSVLAIRPKVRGFKPGQGDGSLRAIKSAAHLLSEVK
jgi:hypothetical protein